MSTPPFHFQKLFELGEDDTEYRLLTSEFVSTDSFEGKRDSEDRAGRSKSFDSPRHA